MTLALILATVLAAAAILALAAVAAQSRLAPGPSLEGKTLQVNTVRPDDQTFRGVCHAQHADRLTLREVVAVHPSGDRALGHLVHVPTLQISTMQEIPPASREASA